MYHIDKKRPYMTLVFRKEKKENIVTVIILSWCIRACHILSFNIIQHLCCTSSDMSMANMIIRLPGRLKCCSETHRNRPIIYINNTNIYIYIYIYMDTYTHFILHRFNSCQAIRLYACVWHMFHKQHATSCYFLFCHASQFIHVTVSCILE